ncbi:SPOR domain-containing protein [Bacillus sp. USDA818B3_A]|uniref:SPOR domain-containing protein n=1 Tax=Bacillus sp. USDA818B3_A TaxID=2698834 RepID=UPI00136F1549|nr:SPOR domain-containing protein [Bacillus sp. USDA818B3_A]
MDKPNKGNTIKIKLNGESQAYQEEPKKIEPEPEPIIDTAPRVIKINSEELDSDVFLETAATQESVDESFDWIIPESSDQDIEEFSIVPNKKSQKASLPKITTFSTNQKKKKDRNFVSILISAAFAILIGTTIGVVMLKLFITGPSDNNGTETISTIAEQGTTTPVEETGEKTNTVTLEQMTTYVIQGGVFTSKEGAKETSTQVAAKGMPTQLVEISGKQFLFLGVADSIETAKSLGNQYKADGVNEVFAKPLLLDEKEVTDVNAKEKAFLENALSIYQTLSSATSTALINNSLSEESTKAIASMDKQLPASGLKNAKVKTLKTELSNASAKVKSFQKSKDSESLNEAQQHLLKFLNAFYAL